MKRLKTQGHVSIVGAGPGDPGLITVKGLDCLAAADLVIIDALAPEELLSRISATAKVVFAGRRGDRHILGQEEIFERMIEAAKAGMAVVRLKGGDPFIFGRGGEEALALARAGVPFEIVPGVTSAVAAPAYAGIPLTHRDVASSVAFVTGHEKELPLHPLLDWSAVARADTIVLLMGIENLEVNARFLVEAGRDPSTPAAAIGWGTRTNQRVVTATLGTMAQAVRESQLEAPGVVVVGEVVRLRPELSWFESRPLFGRRIVVTRAAGQAGELSGPLGALGAEVLEIPTIEFRPPRSWAKVDRALGRLSSYHWVIFTSANGVACFFDRLKEKGGDSRRLGGVKVAAIGPATAAKLKGFGIVPDLVASKFKAEGLLAAMGRRALKDQRVLLPRAEEGREILVQGLEGRGAIIDDVSVYRTVPPRHVDRDLLDTIRCGEVDLVIFTSSATMKHLVGWVGLEALKCVKIACLGPVTAKTARDLGLEVVVQPRSATIPALVSAIVNSMQ